MHLRSMVIHLWAESGHKDPRGLLARHRWLGWGTEQGPETGCPHLP